MNKTKIKLDEYISITPRFQRSVNIFSDWQNKAILDGYIVTPNIIQTLNILLSAFKNGTTSDRAFALIGPYGSGKSAFGVFLTQLLWEKDLSAFKKFFTRYPDLESQIVQIKRKYPSFLPIIITARRRPIAQLILEGLKIAVCSLKNNNTTAQLYTRIEEALDKEYWKDTGSVITLLRELSKAALKEKYSGILLLIDEAGKTLEYALYDREGGDVYIYQEIAELANHRSEIPFLFIISLHQMFDDYVEIAEKTMRNEWTKVQERFHSIQFNETASATIQLIESAIRHKKSIPSRIKNSINNIVSQLEHNNIPLPLGITYKDFHATAIKAWPLHPAVLLAIPYLFRRLGQNERSIFSYLNSNESFGFQEHLRKNQNVLNSFVKFHDLYLYFITNFEVQLSRLPYAKRLLEANDIINSRQNLTEIEIRILQTIALLNVLGEFCPLRATKEFLSTILEIKESEIIHLLTELKRKSLLTYRRLDASYRIWEGSDVDIEARLKEARKKFQTAGMNIAEIIEKYLPRKKIVARRHTFQTGIYRYFNVKYISNFISFKAETEVDDRSAGTIVVFLPPADLKSVIKQSCLLTNENQRIIVAIPKQIDALRYTVEEIACLRWVNENTQELRDDRLARREINLRLIEAEQHISLLAQKLLDPRPTPAGNSCIWIWNGQEHKLKIWADVIRLLSEACDRIYSRSPRIRNELIMRRHISSSASAARRVLLERLLEYSDKELLGMNGYPPERSIYESTIKATGMHIYDRKHGIWKLSPPKDKNLRYIWELMKKKIFENELERICLTELFRKFSQPPYGIPDGFYPILFTIFYLYYQDELFLYRDNTFIPQVDSAILELLQRRPKLFSISGAQLSGIRKAVVERIAKGFGIPVKTAVVVKLLFKILNSLPKVTLRSNKIENKEAIKMRDTLLKAQYPEKLLFSDLPECFGLKSFSHNESNEEVFNLFFQKLNQAIFDLKEYREKLLIDAENCILSSCNLPPNKEGWKLLKEKAKFLLPRITNERLIPFLRAVTNNTSSDRHASESVISLVANRPLDDWADSDIENFPGLAMGYGELFRKFISDYEDAFDSLTPEEIKQKNNVYNILQKQIKKLGQGISQKALKAALKELTSNI